MAFSQRMPEYSDDHSGIDMSPSRQADFVRRLEGPKLRWERKFPRKRMSILVDYAHQNKVFRDFIQDISGGGVFIETRRPLAIGESISMAFKLPDSEMPLKLAGRVVRNDTRGMGVAFDWQHVGT